MTPVEDSQRATLFQQWLDHFGVEVGHELDLGTLAAIAEWVEAGRGPRSPRSAGVMDRPKPKPDSWVRNK